MIPTPADIQHILNLISTHYQPSKIYLFGSYVEGCQTEQSDIDLLIIKDTNEPPNRRILEVYRIIQHLHIDVDVIVYTQKEFESLSNAVNSLPYIVKKKGKLLYEC